MREIMAYPPPKVNRPIFIKVRNSSSMGFAPFMVPLYEIGRKPSRYGNCIGNIPENGSENHSILTKIILEFLSKSARIGCGNLMNPLR
jgi:hypothetical protein